jgi:hypothetical protein
VRPAARSGMGSAGPLRGRKRSLYEGGVRVPFLVRWPKVTPAADVNDTTVISGADLLPTLCELTGTAVPLMCRLRCGATRAFRAVSHWYGSGASRYLLMCGTTARCLPFGTANGNCS